MGHQHESVPILTKYVMNPASVIPERRFFACAICLLCYLLIVLFLFFFFIVAMVVGFAKQNTYLNQHRVSGTENLSQF